MNRLAFKVSDDTHKNAQIIVRKSAKLLLASGNDDPDVKTAIKDSLERFRKAEKENAQVLKDLGIKFEVVYAGYEPRKGDARACGVDKWTIYGILPQAENDCSLPKRNGFELTYRAGVGHRYCYFDHYSSTRNMTAIVVPPSAMEILYCLRSDDPQGTYFEEWASYYGYDTDSRKALDTYNACCKQTMDFRRAYPGINLHEYEPLDNY